MPQAIDRSGPRVIGPCGETLTLEALPPPDLKRWHARCNCKVQVVTAVQGSLLSVDEAGRRYTLSVEEFLAWERALQAYGMPGLYAKNIRPSRS